MPVSYSVSDHILIIKSEGKYSTEEMKNCITSALDDPRTPGDVVLLMDLRGDESVMHRSKTDIRQMSYFFGRIKSRINNRLCMVTDNELAYGLMSMAKVYDESQGLQGNVFNDMDKAIAWLKNTPAGDNPA